VHDLDTIFRANGQKNSQAGAMGVAFNSSPMAPVLLDSGQRSNAPDRPRWVSEERLKSGRFVYCLVPSRDISARGWLVSGKKFRAKVINGI
jgi:hypothetical protein